MSGALVVAILVSGLGVIAVRRRSVAVALVAGQSLALGAGALQLAEGRSSDYLVAALVLVAKAIVLPALLLVLVHRTPKRAPVTAVAGPLVRLAGACGLVLLAIVLLPPLGLHDARVERASVALVLVGIAIVVARRPAFFQLLGLIVAENGLSLLAVSVPGGLSYVIELGALFDLVLVVSVAAAFAERIHLELGTGDTELLRALRD